MSYDLIIMMLLYFTPLVLLMRFYCNSLDFHVFNLNFKKLTGWFVMNFARRHWIFQFLLRMQLRNDGRMFHAEIDRLHLNRRTFCLQQSPPFFRSSTRTRKLDRSIKQIVPKRRKKTGPTLVVFRFIQSSNSNSNCREKYLRPDVIRCVMGL